ncbi:hypothetical protein QW131_10900 [Roseibium salinum]|nr:hypothetical protein [Roseibium salinum]
MTSGFFEKVFAHNLLDLAAVDILCTGRNGEQGQGQRASGEQA